MTSYSPDDLEREVLNRWEKEGTFAASLKRRERSKKFSFYDGPPYATGSPHYGHVLQSTIKDTVTRYWTMRGFRVDRRVGWDCHGLPVENLVEKELGITSRRGIEEEGIEAFNATCRAVVLRHVDEFTNLLKRLGRWADYGDAYLTMDTPFIESAWWVFKIIWERGLISKGLRSSPYCPRCGTPLSNFEAALGYKEVDDPAVTVKLRVAGTDTTYLLVWTTTPWTLPANVAAAVHPDFRYAKVKVGDEHWILAKDRVSEIVDTDYVVEEEYSGSQLVGQTYEPLYEFVTPEKAAHVVVAAHFVSATEGTGIVHVAPAFGAEDLELALAENLPILETVNEHGRFLDAVKPWAGMPVKDADPKIIAELKDRNFLVRQDVYRHQYPFCWRCETPLIYYATTSWFVSVSKVREQLLKNAEQITWVPSHLKEGRFGQGLGDAPDWAVSRTRYWGIPLPAWECQKCGKTIVVGSVEELKKTGGDVALLKSPHANPDLHRPYVDRVVLPCPECESEAKRVPEVLDVWFDSGSMPYGQWHYPFENKELVESTFPADFIGEALEMTRGWFYTLHVLAGILTLKDLGLGVNPSTGLGVNKPAFTHAVASGLILAEDGRKLSKRFGNYPDPNGLIAKYGADTLRLFLLTATRLGDDTRFSERLVGELYRRFTLILWNVWQYYRTYGAGMTNTQYPIPNDDSRASLEIGNWKLGLLDAWILARVSQLAEAVRTAMDAYHLDDAARALIPFVEDLSTWYVRRSRGREEALPVLRNVLRQFSIIAAPFIPFLAEHVHRELVGTSPHLEDFPTFDVGKRPTSKVGKVGEDVLDQMRLIRDLAAAGHRARAEAKIKVRQPLAEVVLVGDFPALAAAGEEGLALLRDELNVKNVILRASGAAEGSAKPVIPAKAGIGRSPLAGGDDVAASDSSSPAAPQNDRRFVWVVTAGGKIGLNTKLTEELKQEGLVRDLVRAVQDLRKRAGFAVDDKIVLAVVADAADARGALNSFGDLLRSETKSRELKLAKEGKWDAAEEVRVGDATVWLGVRRAK